MWKGRLLSSVITAAGGRDAAAWSAWLSEAFEKKPDWNALKNPGTGQFQSIDLNLAQAMEKCVKSSGEAGKELQKDAGWTTASTRKRIGCYGAEVLQYHKSG